MNSMVNKKAAKREKMMNMPSYRLMVGAAKYMDKWFLDPNPWLHPSCRYR